MAKTELISGEYSHHLDNLARRVKEYLERDTDPELRARANKALQDFTFNNSESFKKDFAKAVGLKSIPKAEPAKSSDASFVDDFVEVLSKKEGECIFLLRDTQIAVDKYQAKTRKGFGIAMNRSYCCRTEEDYFALIDLLYEALAEAETVDRIADIYIKRFKKLISEDPHFYKKSVEIADYITHHTDSSKPLIFVDYGFQFTFALFCLASVAVHDSSKRKLDYYAYSVYPWVQNIFKGKYLSEHNEVVLDLELEAVKEFEKRTLDRARGCLVGFAIGDSLGFPAAGIERNDILRFLPKPIRGFEENTKHPYFFHLKSGEYTDNTTSLIVSGESLLKNHGFNIDSYVQDLIAWGKELLIDEKKQRWVGPTMISGIKKLIEGVPYTESGSITTESCSSTYRVIPLGLYYRPFTRDNSENLSEYAATSGMLTHNSELSKAGTIFVALLIADLLNGVLPEIGVEAAIQKVQWTKDSNKLLEKLKGAVRISGGSSVEEARLYFGTGSPIYQTLPLAIFCFIKFQRSFEEGVLAAANSFREDTEEEKERLEGLSFEEQLLEAKGGNCDGIAALTGTFLGAYLGNAAIPERFKKIENYNLLTDLADKLVV